jgi:hypothetical protein
MGDENVKLTCGKRHKLSDHRGSLRSKNFAQPWCAHLIHTPLVMLLEYRVDWWSVCHSQHLFEIHVKPLNPSRRLMNSFHILNSMAFNLITYI